MEGYCVKCKAKKDIKRMTGLKNVGCETCHGPGKAYMKSKIMKGIFSGELKGADYGLSVPTEETCLQCHNKRSPSFKSFVYEDRVKEIAHPYPVGMKK